MRSEMTRCRPPPRTRRVAAVRRCPDARWLPGPRRHDRSSARRSRGADSEPSLGGMGTGRSSDYVRRVPGLGTSARRAKGSCRMHPGPPGLQTSRRCTGVEKQSGRCLASSSGRGIGSHGCGPIICRATMAKHRRQFQLGPIEVGTSSGSASCGRRSPRAHAHVVPQHPRNSCASDRHWNKAWCTLRVPNPL